MYSEKTKTNRTNLCIYDTNERTHIHQRSKTQKNTNSIAKNPKRITQKKHVQ